MFEHLDLIILIILIVSAGIGYAKGFYYAVITVLAFFLGLAAAWQFCIPALDVANDIIGIQDQTAAFLRQEIPLMDTVEQGISDSEALEPILNLVDSSGEMNGLLEKSRQQPISQMLAREMLIAVSFVLIFYTVRMVISTMALLFKSMSPKNEQEWVGRTAGAIFEFTKSLVFIILIMALLLQILEAGGEIESSMTSESLQSIHSSIFYGYFEGPLLFIQSLL